MNLEQKQLKSKCQEILRNYEEIFLFIQKMEEEKINKESKIGETEFETLKRTIYSEGIKEGIRRVLISINNLSNEQ